MKRKGPLFLNKVEKDFLSKGMKNEGRILKIEFALFAELICTVKTSYNSVMSPNFCTKLILSIAIRNVPCSGNAELSSDNLPSHIFIVFQNLDRRKNRWCIFWTYAHPLYYPSNLQPHAVLTPMVGLMHCRSDGHVKNSILVHPTYFKLSLRHVSRSDGPFS